MLALLAAMAFLPATAQAVTVSRAELNSGQLRVEGTAAASAPITVTSDTSTAAGSSSSSASFRVEASSFRSSNCRVTVSDGGRTPTAEATLAGCTPAGTTTPPPSTSTCTIQPQEPTTMNVGTL